MKKTIFPAHIRTAILCWGLLAACATPPALNSERIAARYGSYAVDVLLQNDALRVSSLESGAGGEAVTRTLAMVLFAPTADADVAPLDRRIRDGASIGRTFVDAGWRIDKTTRYLGALAPGAEADAVAAHMRITLPARLALHVYDLEVSRRGRRLTYATIAELHHPDYLTPVRLHRLYGPVPGAASAAGWPRRVREILARLPPRRPPGEARPSNSSGTVWR